MASHLRKTALLVAATALAAIAAPLDEFKYRADMYDFDQRRAGLPNDGNMYCVPTSFVNLCAYLKKYGCTNMTSSYSVNSHSDMTNFIFLQGLLMGTDPEDGTSGSVPDEVYWMDSRTSKAVFFASFGPSSTWGYRTIMNQFRNGAIVRMAYGRYRLVSGEWSRRGGHSVTLAGHQRNDSGAGPNQFFVADPAADDGDLNQQSSFIFQIKDTSNITLTTEDHGVVTHARYTNWVGANGDRRAVVDSMFVVLPLYAGWPAVEGDATTFHIKIPWQMNPSATHQDFATEQSFTIPDGVQDWCFDPTDFSVVYITAAGAVRRRDVATGETTTLLTSAAARKVAVGGPDMDVYVMRAGTLNDSVTVIRRKNGATLTRNLVGKFASIDVDDTTGGLVALSTNGTQATVFDRTFTTATQVGLLSLALEKETRNIASGTPTLRVDSQTGAWYVSTEGSSAWVRYPKAPSARVGKTVEIRGTVRRLFPGPQSTVYVQDMSDRIWTYTQSGLPKATDFSGMQAAGPVCIPRSFTMHNPGEMVGPGWINELPVGNEP
jgi:hypothetical protein